MTNGSSFSEPAWVSSILGVFTFIAVVASFATAVYGENVVEMRNHYAHSLSVLVVFAVWQHIYFSGALSMNWPSVLVAFWSNYAWAGGIVYLEPMQNAISGFIGSNQGNTSTVGAAGTGVANPYLGGGFDIRKIYRREEFPDAPSVPGLEDTLVNEARRLFTKRQVFEKLMAKREVANSSSASSWFGHPVKPGIPLPGNFSGFAGTLAQTDIPASNAFMTGLLWFLILILGVGVSVVAFKISLEGASKLKITRTDRLPYFRRHWLSYTLFAVLRTLFIGFFALIFLSVFQFSYLASSRLVAVACVVFLVMLLGLGGLVGYAVVCLLRSGHYISQPDRLDIEKRKLLKVFPWIRLQRNSASPRSEDKKYIGSLPWWTTSPSSNEKSSHANDEYIKRFGWLTARFRHPRWYFFLIWIVYDLLRACFLAGAITSPLVQVAGLLTIELTAFIVILVLRPFEGQRLNVIAVYGLGFSKVVTLALSVPLAARFGLPRIIATVIGIVIIVVQGLLTIAVLICILLSAASSYMSVMRHRETFHPELWSGMRERYYAHVGGEGKKGKRDSGLCGAEAAMEKSSWRSKLKLKFKAKQSNTPVPPSVPEVPYFSVSNVRRVAKVEDEDEEFMREISGLSLPSAESSMADLMQSGKGQMGRRSPSMMSKGSSWSSLPPGARVHRASWSLAEGWSPVGGWEERGERGDRGGLRWSGGEREKERPRLRTVDSEGRVGGEAGGELGGE